MFLGEVERGREGESTLDSRDWSWARDETSWSSVDNVLIGCVGGSLWGSRFGCVVVVVGSVGCVLDILIYGLVTEEVLYIYLSDFLINLGEMLPSVGGLQVILRVACPLEFRL